MDGRARLAFGGAATVVASVAVIGAVVVSHGTALADSAGVAVDGARIVVVPSPATAPRAAAPVAVLEKTAPETVPAPEPEDIPVAETRDATVQTEGASRTTPSARTATVTEKKATTSPSAPKARPRTTPAASPRPLPTAPADGQDEQHDWSRERVTDWIRTEMHDDADAHVERRADRRTSAQEESSDRDRRWSQDGWKRDQSRGSTEKRD
ncbi:hypothetical protein [Microbacterium terricola]|uniref:hypothetical protein n=1 Tax=Microbacterium terricola TaxID=344163 RepID=UPI0021E9256D|nr:hypothetical protein [Microbacterium terricola]UYK41161.1 hypothetical protein OAU46_05855 [Microbacterium terricola]